MNTFNAKQEIKGRLLSNQFNEAQSNALVQSVDALMEVERKNFTEKQLNTNSKEIFLKLDSKLSQLKSDIMHWVIAVSGAQVLVYITAIITTLFFLRG